MSIFVLNYFFFGFSAFLISIFIILKRGDEVARRWFYFSIFVTIWAIFYAFEVDNKNSNEFALYSARVANACSAFIPVTWLYFVYAFLEIRSKKIFWILCLLAYLMLLSAPTEIFISVVSPAKGFAHISEPGPVFHLHTINFFCIVVFGFYLMVRSYMEEKENSKKQEIRSLFLATAIGFIGGASNYSIIYFRDKGIDLTLLLSSYPFLMAYAMIKHRVLDVEKIADAFQREKLAAVGVLAASIHHELRSPLFVMQGTLESYLQNVQDHVYRNGGSEGAARKAIEISLGQLKRATEIMQKLTDFAKPQSNADHSERVPVEEVFRHVLELVNFQSGLDKIRVSQELEKGLTVGGNRRQFEEILFNLIVNAGQAMKGGGNLTVRAEQRNGTIQVEIEDQGPGIPPDQLAKIFQPFYTTKDSGTGLGLYITKQLVERNKGRITVKSRLNRGTQFILSFPAGSMR